MAMDNPVLNPAQNSVTALPEVSVAKAKPSSKRWLWVLILLIGIIISISVGFLAFKYTKTAAAPDKLTAGSSYEGVWENGTHSKLTIISIDGDKVVSRYEWSSEKESGYITETATIQEDGSIAWKTSARLPYISFKLGSDKRLNGKWELNDKRMTVIMNYTGNESGLF